MTAKIETAEARAPAASEYYRWVVLLIAWLSFLFSFMDRLTWANVAVSAARRADEPTRTNSAPRSCSQSLSANVSPSEATAP